MTRSVLIATLAAGALALGLAACDQQQASDSNSTVPMQQQGAVPPASNSATPLASPQGSDAPAAQPDSEEPTMEQPDAGGSTSQ